MVEAITRPTEMTISLAAVKNNIEVVKATSGADKVFLAVKSNGYGHGLHTMAERPCCCYH